MNREKIKDDVRRLIDAYNLLVDGIDHKADESDRAYGGVIRAGKGTLVESLAKNMVAIVWREIGGKPDRFSLDKQTVKIPINPAYVEKIKSPEVKKYIKDNIHDYYYVAKTDVHVYIDRKFVMGIECKAYTENAMFKRILVDFTLLKQANKDLECVLFQLESQLGGDYGKISKDITYGSGSTHTLMSYFDVDLAIVTLLEGERKVDKPIHKKEFAKKLSEEGLFKAMTFFEDRLKRYL
jgi:hypothetical protein